MSDPTDVRPDRLRRGTGVLSTKNAAFVAMMGALGNILSWLSMSLAPFLPNLPLGPISVSIAFDLSHLTTFTAALYGGPLVGGLTGLIGGAVAANVFGFSQGNFVTGFALPLGKALTGVAAGFIMRVLRLQTGKRHQSLVVVSTLLAYIPEGIFTVFIFLSILPLVFRIPAVIFYSITAGILVKASIEMLIEGLILSALSANQSFRNFILSFFKAS